MGELLLGNEAVGRGLVEAGCRVITSYPGTPSSEILPAAVRYSHAFAIDQLYTEWSTNEKVAFEVALSASWSGLRAAVAMKQVGLNVAADAMMSAAYAGVAGGFVIISADDPGPHSSQTEQDSRLFALFAKIPVLDPATPQEAKAMTQAAFCLSEQFGTLVMVRPTVRVCHARQNVRCDDPPAEEDDVAFRKDPERWVATPRGRYLRHKALNETLQQIRSAFATSVYNTFPQDQGRRPFGIIAGGVCYPTVVEILADLDLTHRVPVCKIGTPYPLPVQQVMAFVKRCTHVLVLEEPDAVIELQLPNRDRVAGRLDGTVPNAGELTPDVIYDVLCDQLHRAGVADVELGGEDELASLIAGLDLPVRRPRLCPGCGHRSAFFAIKRSLPRAIFPGDIGCYTLGANLRAVDTVLDMGASINMAAGFYHAHQTAGEDRPIVATIGDSTFVHAGLPALTNAVHTNARFVLVILDNRVTAMTGFQPTIDSDRLADGAGATAVRLEDLVRGCGVTHVRVVDPYEIDDLKTLLKEAHAYTREPAGGVAVIIARRPCVLYDRASVEPRPVYVDERCDGCRYCLVAFECPALLMNTDVGRVEIDRRICVDCGECIDSCYKGLIVPMVEAN